MATAMRSSGLRQRGLDFTKPRIRTMLRIEKCGGRKDQAVGLKTRGWQFVVVRGEDDLVAAFARLEDAEIFLRAISAKG